MTYAIFPSPRGSRIVRSKKSLLQAISLLALIIGGIFVGSWIWMNLAADEPTALNPAEIREYKGERLGSIGDFRENSIKGPQDVNLSAYRLAITGLVQNQIAYTYNETVDEHTHYEKVVTIYCVEGWEVKILWEGILLKDLLEEAGYDRSAQVVIFYAQDGYSTSLPLSYIIENDILLAFKMNGVILPPERGFPFQLVAESKYGYKWIKWVTRIEVSNDTSYRGYWESRGFDNEAGLP
jgi:DMSO/TMAO reductase YedYZ molybdopterin-dependent catalytic subunit